VRRTLLLILGSLLAALGLVVMLLPVPVPMGGVALFALGCAILSANSRMGRRVIQRARHRSIHLSQAFERFARHLPQGWAHALRRTRPDAIARRIRIAARKA